MSTKIQKWGNSLAVRLPQYLIEKLGLEAGTTVDIEEESGKVITIKPTANMKLSLKKMMSQVTDENKHELVDWGGPFGKEIW